MRLGGRAGGLRFALANGGVDGGVLAWRATGGCGAGGGGGVGRGAAATGLSNVQRSLYGVALILSLIFMPDGLVSLFRRRAGGGAK